MYFARLNWFSRLNPSWRYWLEVCKYMPVSDEISVSWCSRLYDSISESTSPSSFSITIRRSLMKLDVFITIWFLSLIASVL